MKRISVLLLGLLLSISVNAQSLKSSELPIDSKVRYGVLDNGLTYYIRHNALPEKRADFYIAQKVGSMQEEDYQAGLAHFLEHMAFNGTKHFPGRKTMLNYMESIGAKFGVNVNAYTSFDETVYTLSNIPVVRQGVIDSTLLILHDWAGSISLINDEIDKERPIIKEEWRTRAGSGFRIWEKQLPVIFKNSKYADRLPIGKMNVVENFEYQVIKDYYKKWYRPDLQGIIVVGDIDADQVEAQVKKMFSTIPMPQNPAERVYFSVPDNKDPIISVVADKEESNSRITYFVKHDLLPKSTKLTKQGYATSLAISIATTILSERLSSISKTAESPFNASAVYDGSFFVSKTKNAWTSIAISKEGMEKESLASLLRETRRIKLFGITEPELERAKANYSALIEQTYNNRDKEQNGAYVREYVRSFVDNEPIPGIEYEYNLIREILPQLTISRINELVKKILTDENNIITITGPQKDGLILPSESEVLNILKQVEAEEIKAHVEEVITKPLISKEPKAGKVVKETKDSTLGITYWTLSNGIRIAIKPTTLKDDEILLSSIAYGGTSLALNSQIYEAGLASSVPYIGGIGDFNSSDLKKVLAGNTANLNVFVGDATHGLRGQSSVKDLETLMKLTYLYFSAPRKDESMFENVKNILTTQVQNASSKPEYALEQNISFARYGYNPRMAPMTEENIQNINYDVIIDFYKTLFSNPSSFVFTIVGNVDQAKLKPLVETYLASLPSGNADVSYNKKNILEYRKGKLETVFEQTMIEPKTTVYNVYSAQLPYNQKTRQTLDFFSQILDIVYVRTIREEEGGTYGVSQRAAISRIPEGQATLKITFDSDPEKVKTLSPMVHSEIEKIAENGPENEDFQKVKEYSIKKLSEDQILNNYWRNVVEGIIFNKEDNNSKALQTINAVTPQDIQAVAKEFLSQGNLIEVIMNPLKK